MTKTEKLLFALCAALAVLLIVLIFTVNNAALRILFVLLAAAIVFLLAWMLDRACAKRGRPLLFFGKRAARTEPAPEPAGVGEAPAAACDVDGEEVVCELEDAETPVWPGGAGEDGEAPEPAPETEEEDSATAETEAAPGPPRETDAGEEPPPPPERPAKDAAEKPAADPKPGYIGHIINRKFHLPDCLTLPAEKNRAYFTTREEALEQGFEPCTNCYP